MTGTPAAATHHYSEAVANLREALVVIAHPDDESFGLGGVLAGLAACGARLRVLCFTRGEASTLGAEVDLAIERPRELVAAAEVLAVAEVSLFDYPDGSLARVLSGELEHAVEAHLGEAEALVVFEPQGVTGHPDHQAATRAAERVAAHRGLPVLEWGIPRDVAEALNDEFDTNFVGIDGYDVVVDREVQWRAIRCHRTQSHDNHVLYRRLELQGNVDRVRFSAKGPSALPPGVCLGVPWNHDTSSRDPGRRHRWHPRRQPPPPSV